MSQLIRIRNRMKAVETIKKVTHAMRLISMSAHMRLRDQEPYIFSYKEAIDHLFLPLYAKFPTWKSPVLNPEQGNRNLIILIGSQKGLCGNFNTALFAYFKKKISGINLEHTDFITVGKKVTDFARSRHIEPVQSFDVFTSIRIVEIANKITQIMFDKKEPYSSIQLVNNYQKSFFQQKQRQTQLVPINVENLLKGKADKEPLQDYIWEEDPLIILERLAHLHMVVTLEFNLFESILSEQAARFISMDSSTRNAKNVLENMRKQYNKLRQTKITKELTELSTSFQTNSSS